MLYSLPPTRKKKRKNDRKKEEKTTKKNGEEKNPACATGQLSVSTGVECPLERILVAVANNQSDKERKKEKKRKTPQNLRILRLSRLFLVEDWSVEQVSASTAIERGSVGFESTDNLQRERKAAKEKNVYA